MISNFPAFCKWKEQNIDLSLFTEALDDVAEGGELEIEELLIMKGQIIMVNKTTTDYSLCKKCKWKIKGDVGGVCL